MILFLSGGKSENYSNEKVDVMTAFRASMKQPEDRIIELCEARKRKKNEKERNTKLHHNSRVS
jgi:hypothetical protein